jgi:hypothetical protein
MVIGLGMIQGVALSGMQQGFCGYRGLVGSLLAYDQAVLDEFLFSGVHFSLYAFYVLLFCAGCLGFLIRPLILWQGLGHW